VRGTQFSITLNPDGTIANVAVYRTLSDDGLVLAITSATGATQTFVIKDGEIWQAGNPNPVPITPQLKTILQEVFAALRTPYFQNVSFDYDRTQTRESSDFGF
jgi:hypothetical protein